MAAAQQQSQGPSYIVKSGDTLYSIAFRYGKDYRQVAAANGIAAPYTIYPGQRIIMHEAPRAPVASAPTVSVYPATAAPTAPQRSAPTVPASRPNPSTQYAPPPAPGRSLPPSRPTATVPPSTAAGASLPTAPTAPVGVAAAGVPAHAPEPLATPSNPTIATAPTPGAQATATLPAPAPASAPEAAPPGTAAAAKPAAEAFTGEKITVWRWPTTGPVIRGYSESVHKGIDIGGERGDPVNAVAAGKVVYAGSGIAGFGELLIIKHNDVYLSAYGHNDELLVTEGDTVAVGQVIAHKGSSGTDSVKLHFEIRQEGKPIDPQRLLPRR